MATQNSINQGDSTRIFTGIESWGGAGNYFDDTTLGSFSVLRAGKGYIKGRPITWAGSQTITGLAAGTIYWICIDVTGTIVKFDTFTTAIFTDNIPLFECLRDSTSPTNNQYTVREDHPYWVEANTSIYLHNVIGPVIRNTNNGANITLKGTQQIQIVGTDYLEDHGLVTTISDSAGAAVTFRKAFTNAGGKWCTYTNTDTFTGHYNNAGTVTALSSGNSAVYTLYVSKDTITSSTPTYYAVMHTAQFASTTAANTAIANGTTAKATNELYNLELAQLGYIIFRESTSAISTVTISKSTLKQTLSTSGSNVAANITTNVTNFDGILSAADTTAQAALETIDEWGKTTTDHSLILGNGTGSALGSLGVASDGQLPIGSSGADPVLATITAGTNITVTNAAGSITLSQTTVGINLQTADYTLALSDAGKLVDMQHATNALILTIPKNAVVAFPVGSYVLICQGLAGTVSIEPVDGDVTLLSTDSLTSLYGLYSVGALIKTSSDTWLLMGDLA